MASKKELRALITLAGKVDPSLQAAMMKATKMSSNFSNQSKKAATSLNKVGTIAKGVFMGNIATKAFSSIGSGLVSNGRNAIQLASDLTEVQNVVDTTFGNNSAAINAWSKQALNAYGLSELSAKQYNGTLGAMMKSSGLAGDQVVKMSQNLTGLAGDFASFYNLSQDDAFEKIRSGISGETEPLRQLGINMNVANLQAFALSKGIKTSYDSMDQASQTALRYSYLMSVSKDAQGDFAKTQDSFANQQRLLNTNMLQFSATLAYKVIPYINILYQKANKFIANLDVAAIAEKVSVAFKNLGNVIKFVSDNSSILIPVLGGTVSAIAAFQVIHPIYQAFKKWQILNEGLTLVQYALNTAMSLCPLVLMAAGIGLVVAAGIALYRNWDTVSSAAVKLWSGIKAAFAGGVNWVIGKINSLIDIINKIPGIAIPKFNLVDGTTAMSGNAVAMTKFANGGIANRPSIFGEAGDEMAIPLKRNTRSLGLLNQTAEILGVRSNNLTMPPIELTFNFNGPISNKEDVKAGVQDSAQYIRDVVEDMFNEKRRVSFG